MNATAPRSQPVSITIDRRAPSAPKPRRLLILLFVAFLGIGSVSLTGSATPSSAEEGYSFSTVDRSFDGEWSWRDDEGTWTIVLKPTGENAWDVAIWFPAAPAPGAETQIYRGTAKGALDGGAFESWIADPGGTRYVIRGTIEEGKFSGIHYIVEDDKEVRNGTLTFG